MVLKDALLTHPLKREEDLLISNQHKKLLDEAFKRSLVNIYTQCFAKQLAFIDNPELVKLNEFKSLEDALVSSLLSYQREAKKALKTHLTEFNKTS